MVATFNGNPSATIISSYSPTNYSEETDLIDFYNDLCCLFHSIPKHNVLVISGDMNSQIGEATNSANTIRKTEITNIYQIWRYELGLHAAIKKKNSERNGKLWTYTYVFIKMKWNNSAFNCDAYLSFNGVSSDHRIVTAKMRMSLRRNTARTTTIVHYDWSLINYRNIRDKHTLTLRNKFDALWAKSETHTSNDKYENFVNSNLEGTAEWTPTKQRAKTRDPWETLAVKKKGGDVRTASKCNWRNTTNINALRLKKAQNEFANIYLKEQPEYIQKQINKIEDSVEDKQSRIAWQTINE